MKKRLVTVLMIGIAVTVVLFGVSRAKFVKKVSKDRTPAEALVKPNATRLARGEYLVNHVVMCLDCHSHRDWNYHAGPIIAGTEGMGGQRFGYDVGLPGTVYSKNITPAGIGHWSDVEMIKAMTQGVNKDGETLFPLMPYMFYRDLSQEDLLSIIAYVRTFESIPNEIPKRQLDIPMEVIMPAIPPPVDFQAGPDRKNSVEYGKYLATIASCVECHTPMENGQFIEGMEFAGGYRFEVPNGNIVYSQNITPDLETGIGRWDKQTFIAIFKAYSKEEVKKYPLSKGDPNTFMPWTLFSGMTDEDLGAIYDYLRTVKPIKNKVDRFVKVTS